MARIRLGWKPHAIEGHAADQTQQWTPDPCIQSIKEEKESLRTVLFMPSAGREIQKRHPSCPTPRECLSKTAGLGSTIIKSTLPESVRI